MGPSNTVLDWRQTYFLYTSGKVYSHTHKYSYLQRCTNQTMQLPSIIGWWLYIYDLNTSWFVPWHNTTRHVKDWCAKAVNAFKSQLKFIFYRIFIVSNFYVKSTKYSELVTPPVKLSIIYNLLLLVFLKLKCYQYTLK